MAHFCPRLRADAAAALTRPSLASSSPTSGALSRPLFLRCACVARLFACVCVLRFRARLSYFNWLTGCIFANYLVKKTHRAVARMYCSISTYNNNPRTFHRECHSLADAARARNKTGPWDVDDDVVCCDATACVCVCVYVYAFHYIPYTPALTRYAAYTLRSSCVCVFYSAGGQNMRRIVVVDDDDGTTTSHNNRTHRHIILYTTYFVHLSADDDGISLEISLKCHNQLKQLKITLHTPVRSALRTPHSGSDVSPLGCGPAIGD